MKLKKLGIAVLAALGATAASVSLTACNDSNGKKIVSVEFVETAAAPSTVDTMSTNFVTAKAVVTYDDGSTKDFPLSYHTLFGVNDKVGGNTHPAGQAYDDTVERLLGEERPLRFTTLEKKGFFSKLFGG